MSVEDDALKTVGPRTSGLDIASALDDALRFRDWPKVTKLLLHAPLSLVHAPGGLSQIQLAIEQMPTDFRNAQPDLRFLLEFTGLVPISNSRFQDIDRLFSGPPNTRAVLVRGLTISLITRRMNGRIDEALEVAELAEDLVLVEANRIGSAAEGAASAYFAQAAKTHLLAGNHTKALDAYLQAWKWRHQDELGFIAHEAAGNIALIHALAGRLEQGKEWVARSQAWSSSISPDYSPVVEFAAPLAAFIIAFEELDLLKAKALLPDLAQPTHGFEFYHLVAEARARFLLLSGQAPQAQQQISEASHWLPQDTLRCLNTDTLISRSDLKEASVQLEMIHEPAIVHLFRARIAALHGEYQVSLDELASGAIHATDRTKLDYLLLQATSQLALGMRTEARGTFESLLTHLNGCIAVFTSGSEEAIRALFDLIPESPRTNAIYEKWASSGVGPSLLFPEGIARAPMAGLTSRELVILKQLLRGSSRKEVAARESVSLNTVKTQSRSAFRKLGVSTVQEARTKGIELGII